MVKEGGVFLLSVAMYGATSMFPLDRVIEPSFADKNLFYQALYCILTITHIELKYISAWSLGMISMRASGITYNPSKNTKSKEGKIEEHNFSRI